MLTIFIIKFGYPTHAIPNTQPHPPTSIHGHHTADLPAGGCMLATAHLQQHGAEWLQIQPHRFKIVTLNERIDWFGVCTDLSV